MTSMQKYCKSKQQNRHPIRLRTLPSSLLSNSTPTTISTHSPTHQHHYIYIYTSLLSTHAPATLIAATLDPIRICRNSPVLVDEADGATAVLRTVSGQVFAQRLLPLGDHVTPWKHHTQRDTRRELKGTVLLPASDRQQKVGTNRDSKWVTSFL